MKKIARFVFALLVLVGCAKQDIDKAGTLDVEINVPKAPRTVSKGQTITIYTYHGKNPLITDTVLLKGDGGLRFEFPIDKVESDRFSFRIGDTFTSGVYTFCIKRGEQVAECGTVNWTVAGEIEPAAGATVYGRITCGNVPVQGVQVSDGYEVVYTDGNGVYNMSSGKKNGMVYITVPSGYEVASKESYDSQVDGVLPLFWKKTAKTAQVTERIDFSLFKVDGQENHTVLFIGDLHLAGGKQDDMKQFGSFTSDVTQYIASHPGEHIYAFTLGDMTWDLYWYDRKFCFTEYLNAVKDIKGMPIFSTIGNHDHNMKTDIAGSSAGWDAVDWDTAGQFRGDLGPNYYSVNIGNVHYIAIDDIYCKNTTGGKSSDRDYTDKISSDCMAWIKKDLAHADKTMPVVVTMHAPVHDQNGSNALSNSTEFKNLFAGFSSVKFISGHTHRVYNVDGSGSYAHISEHNSGAVCAAWWWAGYYYPGMNIATDGSPSGYRIMDVKGSTMTSRYKGVGLNADVQFRTYDRNSIDFSSYSLPSDADDILKIWKSASSANYVYINVWDYGQGWNVSVTENGKALTVKKVTEYDPLYTLEYMIKRYNGKTGSLTFPTTADKHFFMVQASSATSTLEISVTDDEGREYKETMKRPKAFTVDTYK